MEPLTELLQRYGWAPDSEPVRQMSLYLKLLERWNRRVNLTASLEWPRLGPLVEEAAWAARRYPGTATSHLDIGSGAGFPALPLRILVPRIRLDMVESRTKRASFLETVVGELGLACTRVFNQRLAECLDGIGETWDCVSWKGLRLRTAEIRALIPHAHQHTRFWMFHGVEAAAEDPAALEAELRLESRAACPARRGWWLSSYRKREACFT